MGSGDLTSTELRCELRKMLRKLLIVSTLLVFIRALEILDYSDMTRFNEKPSASVSTRVKKEIVSSPAIFSCYYFTWPGLDFNESTTDCHKKEKQNPCILPFVITDDHTIPDPAIVKHYCDIVGCKVTCNQSPGGSCIRYSYYTNNQLKNQSYFCGSGKDVTDQVSITSGEFFQKLTGENAGDGKKVKFCSGDSYCNSSRHLEIPITTILTILAIHLLVQ